MVIDTNNHFVGKTVKRFRSKRGKTQMDVAKELGHETPQYISNLERGKTFASIEMSLKLARILNIPKSVLFSDLRREYEVILKRGFSDQA